MSENEIKAVEDMLRAAGPALASMAPPELRITYDAMGEITPLADGAIIEPVDIGDIRIDFISSPAAVLGRTVLYCHGGGYAIGSVRSHGGMTSYLGRHAHARVALVDFRLAPEHPYPAAIDDVITAYQWLLADGTHPSQIAFAGDSAGGGLALSALLRIRDERLPLPAAALLFSPWADLSLSGDTLVQNADKDVLASAPLLESMAADYLAGTNPRTPYASAIFGDLNGLPPMLIHVGTSEILLSDTLRLVRCAALAEVSVQLRVWPRMPHTWQLFADMLEEGHQSIAEAGAFLDRHLN